MRLGGTVSGAVEWNSVVGDDLTIANAVLLRKREQQETTW